MQKSKSDFKALLFGDDGRGFFQVWQSTEHPRLQVWVFGKAGSTRLFRQYRVEDWDPEVETLEEAISICNSGKKRRRFGVPPTYVYRGPVDTLRSVIPEQKLRASDIHRPLGPYSSRPNRSDQQKSSGEAVRDLPDTRRNGESKKPLLVKKQKCSD
jgi:hypothetical protein